MKRMNNQPQPVRLVSREQNLSFAGAHDYNADGIINSTEDQYGHLRLIDGGLDDNDRHDRRSYSDYDDYDSYDDVDSFYDDFDSFAVLRVILPSGEIRHFYQEEYQGISFVVDGLYEIAAYDRNGNIVEFSVTVE